MHQFGFKFLLDLTFILVLVTALIALPCAIVITLALNRLFRSRVGRSMGATSRADPHPDLHQPSAQGPQGTLEIEPIAVTPKRATTARAVPVLAEARRQARRLAALYTAAAAASPLLVAAAGIGAISFSPTEGVILKFALLYSLFVLAFGTPVALAPTVILKRQPRFLILAVIALVVTMWACERSLGTDLFAMWLRLAAVPTGAVLLLNTRHLRAIGPVVFAVTLLLLCSLVAGGAYGALYALDAIGPIKFVQPGLAQLPFLDAFEQYLAWFWNLPLPQKWDEIATLRSSILNVITVANPGGLTATIKLHFYGIWLAATAVGVTAAWAFMRWLARSYQARRASDQMLTLDVLILIFTLVFLGFSVINWWLVMASALAGFIGYKLVTRWGLRHRRGAALLVTPRTLLLLRVFGFDRRTQRLLEALGQRWRYLGPIRLIGGTDLAYTTIEPHEFFEFINGRLSRAFIKGRDDLESRLSENTPVPDPDGLFRIEDFFCLEATWRMTVARLAREADAVLMDLRGFTRAHRGCIFEIEQLIGSVSLHRIVLLVDGSTDGPFLEQTLQGAWRVMPVDSPNAVVGQHRLRVLQASANHGRTLDSLLGLLCESFGESIAPRGRAPTAS